MPFLELGAYYCFHLDGNTFRTEVLRSEPRVDGGFFLKYNIALLNNIILFKLFCTRAQWMLRIIMKEATRPVFQQSERCLCVKDGFVPVYYTYSLNGCPKVGLSCVHTCRNIETSRQCNCINIACN